MTSPDVSRWPTIEQVREAQSMAYEALASIQRSPEPFDIAPFLRGLKDGLAALARLADLADAAENMVTPGDGWKATEADARLRAALAACRANTQERA